jgi:hypothetical protein
MLETIESAFTLVPKLNGKRLDPGIRRTVYALRLLGFDTTMSCEGHAARACPFPWVHLDNTPTTESRIRQLLADFQPQHQFVISFLAHVWRLGVVTKRATLRLEGPHIALEESQAQMRAFTDFLLSGQSR